MKSQLLRSTGWTAVPLLAFVLTCAYTLSTSVATPVSGVPFWVPFAGVALLLAGAGIVRRSLAGPVEV